MTTLEIVLICFSSIEMSVSFVLYQKLLRKYKHAQQVAEDAERKYESLRAVVPVARNLL